MFRSTFTISSYLEEGEMRISERESTTPRLTRSVRFEDDYQAHIKASPIDNLRVKRESLINTKKSIGKEIQEAGEQCIDVDYVERFCNSISMMLDNLSFEEKKTVLREVIEKVIIKDSEISIYGIIPAQGELDDIEDVSIESRSSTR